MARIWRHFPPAVAIVGLCNYSWTIFSGSSRSNSLTADWSLRRSQPRIKEGVTTGDRAWLNGAPELAPRRMGEHQTGMVSLPLWPVEASLRTARRWFTASPTRYMTSGTTECSKQRRERGRAAARRDRAGTLRIYSNQTRGECEKTAEESLGCLYKLHFGSQMFFVKNKEGN